ncbi:MAG: HAMP domain-containing histidine kinase, partial [Actinomycetota bacterium]|nr:HAMP domain-containing histidine kinase [Actinomycetota bacterium]
MTLRTRLALGLLAIAALLVVPLFIARRSLESFDETMKALESEEFTASLLLGRMRGRVEDLRSAELSLFARVDSTSLAKVYDQYRALAVSTDSLTVLGLEASPPLIRAALRTVPRLAQSEFAAVVVDDTAAADALSDSLRAVITVVELRLGSAEGELGRRMQTRVDIAGQQSADAREAALLAFAMAALLATLIGGWLVRSISGPVRDLERGMDAVASGEFGYRLRLKPDRADEFGRLAASYTTMSAQLAELDKLKAEFVSVASHELKTPINVIGGYLQLLDEGVYGALSPKQAEVCGTISAQCDSLARLVRQLLDVSRFE